MRARVAEFGGLGVGKNKRWLVNLGVLGVWRAEAERDILSQSSSRIISLWLDERFKILFRPSSLSLNAYQLSMGRINGKISGVRSLFDKIILRMNAVHPLNLSRFSVLLSLFFKNASLASLSQLPHTNHC